MTRAIRHRDSPRVIPLPDMQPQHQTTQQITRQARDSPHQVLDGQEEPSRAALVGIQGFRMALEGHIANVFIDMNLLRADLCNVADKVLEAETYITSLQAEVKQLKQQMTHITLLMTALEDRAEDT
ncbi:hypothetical protein NDU88_004481 [Pleurodeles waltl]|uniref:Uncharacterized protein n=1 Tax=Pleurodeles waltl TaxID=8319 RepID=A0AAV7QD52_PLEWA|nr:hypothetical protein NDU88_004481 [Pleurodeles waltl]